MKWRLSVALIAAVVFTVLGIGANDVLGPAYRDYRIGELYHEYALEIEDKFPCIDVLGIDNTVRFPSLLAFVIEFRSRDMDCINDSGTYFWGNLARLIREVNDLGAGVSDLLVCTRLSTEPKGYCWADGDYNLVYPVRYNMWPGRGK